MKTSLFILLLILPFINVSAQPFEVKLPPFSEGKYVSTTIYEYHGQITATYAASVSKGLFKFVTGVKFYFVLDSGSATQYITSTKQWIPIKVGEKIELPVSFRGGRGFHLVVEGTPTTAGETYACDLYYAFTTGEDFGMMIMSRNQQNCLVDQIQGITPHEPGAEISVYPNPSPDVIYIKGRTINSPYIIYDELGKTIQSGRLTGLLPEIDIRQLIPGNYLIQIGSEQQTLKFVKK